ncbi:MAG: autotransporter domain-containing protein, partial [Kiritimatiellales bacterium]|nr:autotransporter domain-containing protein [Kiritimatiellales bacterium]
VGYESNNNELLVSGTNSHLKAQGTTYIGSKSDNNSLTIEESGSADIDGVLYVGNTPGASGNKVYVRSGGQLSVQTNIVIGANGSSNHLNIEEGGKLVAKENIIIGRETGAKSNTMTVSGSNTTVSVANDLIVGKLGSSNTMTLQGGTTTVDGNLMIGVEGASNTATVTGSNTVLTASGLTVGQTGGSNKFYLKEGASVTFSNDVVFGQSSNDNLLDVLGSNSTFNALANLTVGENGENNSLSIKGGTANIGIDLVIGATSNNNSTVVTGANSILNVGGAFYVGQNSSSNTLTISQGGKANAFNADIGATSNLVGNTVTISGKNSLLYVTNNLAIGSNSGSNNAVNVNSGGTLFVGNGISIGTATNDLNNRLNVNSGGTLQTIDWDFATVSTNILLKKGSTLELGGTLSNTNQVEGGIGIALNGSLATNNAIWNTGTDILHVGYGTGANSLTVKNGGFATTETNLVVGQSAKSTGNTLTATGMASRVFVGNDLVIGNKDSSSNHMKILGGGKIDVANNLVLGLKSGSNTGLLEGFAGTNSFLNITNNLIVGSEGSNNTLTISSNATVHVLSLATIGSDANNNTLKLTGSNAVFTVESNLVVGAKAASNNKLEISEGTANLNHDLIIGANTNSHDNTVGVYGSNSTLNIANDLYVGKEGSNNQLEITDALTTVYGNAFVGFGTNSRNNAIVVSGTNSIFNVASNLYAGYGGGLNSLSAESGALVNITNDAYIGFASSNNWISVSGSNSTLNVWNNLFVGNSATNISGDNAFRVLEAATAHIDGNLSLSKGELEIGSGSQVTVSGNYDQDEFSTLVLGISTNSPTTNLVVGGTAGFAKGTSIKIDLGDTEVRMGETNKYAQTLVSATDGLKVDGNTATTESLNNEALIVINPDSLIDVNLIVTNDTIAIANLIRLSIASRSGLIGTPLEPVADEIDAMADGSNDVAQVMRDILNDLGSDGRNTAMNDYYGEKQSSVPTHNLINQGIGGFANQLTMRGDNTRARMAATAPAGAAGPHSAGQELQGWIAGFGTRFNESASDGFDGYDGSTHGFLIGTDLSVAENILVGIAGGSGDSSVDKDNGASSDAKTTYGAIYASLGTKDWFVDTSLIYGSSSIDNTLGSLFDTTASYDAKNIAFFLGGGKEMIGDYLIITPQASILGNYYKQDAYEEKSTTAVGRSVDSFDTLYVQSAVGCSLGVYMGLGEMTLKPELSAHWLHEFNASNETLPYSLIGGTGTYSMELQAPEEDILKLGIGMSAKMSEYLELRADLDTRRGSDYSDYTMFGSIRYQF